jgi:glycine/D-amino acid oxidase-like deaminating enzyme
MAPGIPPTDGAVAELLAEKIRRYLPKASEVAIKSSWAGFRTLTPDGLFIIGWDPRVKGFFWVAGLGGHGMTTSYAVGGLAARLIVGDKSELAEVFSPQRFL